MGRGNALNHLQAAKPAPHLLRGWFPARGALSPSPEATAAGEKEARLQNSVLTLYAIATGQAEQNLAQRSHAGPVIPMGMNISSVI